MNSSTSTITKSPKVATSDSLGKGWIRELPDHRDLKFSVPYKVVLPNIVDLRASMPNVYDQGSLNSCTAHIIAAAIEFERKKQKLPDFIPSRLFLYYLERALENTVLSDCGSTIRSGLKAVNKNGVCSEMVWPYRIEQFATSPIPWSYTEGMTDKSLVYMRLPQSLNAMKACLASGYAFTVGITIYESFESDTVAITGTIPMPSYSENFLGGHAVLCCGYDDVHSQWILRNSWGTSWGMTGYFTLPYAYLLEPDLSSDFWLIRVVTTSLYG
jgi:C1A family cysteine protease